MMFGSRTDRTPLSVVDRDWYFDEDGTLAVAPSAGHGSRLLECLGLAYAAVGLALGSPGWFARDKSPEPDRSFVPEKRGVAA